MTLQILCTAVYVIILSCWPHSRFFAFSFYLMVSQRQVECQEIFLKKERGENEAEKEELHELPCTETLKSRTIRLAYFDCKFKIRLI